MMHKLSKKFHNPKGIFISVTKKEIKMKFETHNTQIFRLLEEAVQLKEDSNIPCLVRYTEKGLVGEYNKKYFIGKDANAPFVCYKLDSDGEVELPEVALYRTYLPYYCFEIVGTLVDTHSVECMTMDGDEKPIRVAPSLFISSYPNGWEIDDKEQKFANVKAGDSIMCSDGRVRIVDKVGDKPDKRNGKLWFNLQVEDWGCRTFYFDGTLQVPERELRFNLEYVCEPETQKPTYQVGDWVEYRLDGNTYYGKLCDIRGYVHYLSLTTEEIPKDQSRAIMLERIIRKLKPSEVIVNIGCLRGTVRRINYIYFALNPSKAGWVVPEAHIPHAMLDTNTRSLVESLLEAQEEEK